MARADVILPAEPASELPVVRSIGIGDLRDALRKGLDDFRAMPTHVVFLCLIYPIVGLALGRAAFGADVVPLLYPLASGFALIGPFAAIGLYELSRRREQGLDTSWKHAFDIVHSPSIWAIVGLGLLLLAIFAVGWRSPTRSSRRTSATTSRPHPPSSPAGCSPLNRATTSSLSAMRWASSLPCWPSG